jgi:hypothetical protein
MYTMQFWRRCRASMLTIANHFSAAGEEDEVVGAVPLFDDIQAFVDFTTECFAVKVLAQEDGLDRPAAFRERLVGRMLNVAPDKAAQDRFGLDSAETDGRDIFDHLVVLLADQFPVDRLGQNGLQIRVGIRLPDIRSGQFLGTDRLQPRHELEPQQPTEREGDRALVMGVHVLAIDLHFGAVMDRPLDH